MDIGKSALIASLRRRHRGPEGGARRGLPLLVRAARLALLLLCPACGVGAILDRMDADGDGVVLGQDCDPDDPAVGQVAVYTDADGDGHGKAPSVGMGCVGDDGVALVGDDCDDRDAAIWEDATWYLDNDRDGYGVEPGVPLCASAAAGYALVSGDCQDDDPGAWPGAPTGCDGDDNDCDGQADAECGVPEGGFAASDLEVQLSGVDDARLGSSMAAGGDGNGDGGADLVVGAPNAAEGKGAVVLVYGATEGLVWALGEEQERVAVVEGPRADAGFGSAVAGGVDINQDGYGDLLVGAPQAGGGGGGGWTGARARPAPGGTGRGGKDGAIYLIPGPLPAGTWSAADLWSVGTLSGDNGGQTGAALACGADWSGDDVADCLIGAPTWKTDADRPEAGAVFGLAPPMLGGDSLAEVAGLEIVGSTAYERFGAALAMGDVDGDGVRDLVVGAPTDITPGGTKHETHNGRAYLIRGASAGAIDLSDAADQWFEGDPSAGLGATVASGQDIDSDGYDELVVSAPWGDDGGTDRGEVWVLSGALLSAEPLGALDLAAMGLATLGGETDGDLLGTSVALMPDLDGDGRAELAVGAPGFQTERGAAILYLGPMEGGLTYADARLSVVGSDGSDGFGFCVADVGDLNGLGVSDLGVGGRDPTMLRPEDLSAGQALGMFMDAW